MTLAAILETERLLLREFVEEDAEAFYPLGSDPAVTRYTGDGGLTSIEHARTILRTYPIADYQKYGYGRWACILKEDGKLIGFAGLKYLDDLKEVDLGYRLLPACWGRGLATEAALASLRYGFDKLHLVHLPATGFSFVGRISNPSRQTGRIGNPSYENRSLEDALERIIGLVVPVNVASVRVLEKVGLTFAGMLDYRSAKVAKYVIEAGAAGRTCS